MPRISIDLQGIKCYYLDMNSDEIKRLRKHLKMTQQQFADKLGVVKITIYRWEHGLYEPHPVFTKMLEELKENKNGNTNTDN